MSQCIFRKLFSAGFFGFIILNPQLAQCESGLTESMLPPDSVAATALVHQLKYPLQKKMMVSLSPAYFYGDKFLSTKGLELDARWFLKEKLAVGLGGGFYRSSVVDEAYQISNNGRLPFTYDPKLSLRAYASFFPAYGKIAFEESIFHFRPFADLGIQVLSLKGYSGSLSGLVPASSLSSRLRFGPYAALGSWFAITSALSAELKLSLGWAQGYEDGSAWRRSVGLSVGVAGRFSP